MKFELVSTQEVFDVEIKEQHYTVIKDYDANTDTSELNVYDENGNTIEKELEAKIIDFFLGGAGK